MYKQLRESEYSKFPFIRIPEEGENLTTFEGFQRLVMLDRYTIKDTLLETLKVGDIVLTTVKDDPKYPLMGYGTVKKINGNTVTVSIEYPEFVPGIVDLDNVEKSMNEIIKPLEIYWEQIAYRVAKAIAEAEKPEKREEVFKNFYWMIANLYYIPGGRILYGAGNPANVTLFNCFSLGTIPDSRSGIIDHIKVATEIMSRGGGVGSCISSLRPRNAVVIGVNGFSSGSVSWANYLSDLTHLISQAGSRRGAQMIGLHVWHPDVLEFIMCKIQNPYLLDLLSQHHNPRIAEIAERKLVRDENGEPKEVVDKDYMSGANISVLITDDFMEKVKANEIWELKYPDLERLTLEQKEVYDKEWHNMKGLIQEWEERGFPVKVYETISARDLWDLINICARYSAEPGVIFIDRYNKEANSYYYTNIDITNPCQPKGEYILTEDGFKKIENIVDHIVLEGKKYKSTPMFKTGTKEVYKVTLENGTEIRMTDNHRVTTPDGDIELRYLKEGSKVLVDYTPVFEPVVTNQEEYEKGILLGWLLADGSLYKQDEISKRGWITIAVGENEFEYKDRLEQMLRKYDPNFEFKPHASKPNTCYEGRICKYEYREKLLKDLKINSETNKFDIDYDKLTKDMKLGLLRALFTCDGSSRCEGIATLYSNNKQFLLHIQRILKEFGVYSSISVHNNGRKYKSSDGKIRNNDTTYKIMVYDVTFKKIGFLTEYKNKTMMKRKTKNSSVIEKKKRTLKIKSIEFDGIEDVYDITVDVVHHYNTNGLIVHNCGEQGLPKFGTCNLGAINLAKMSKNGKVDYELLEKVVRISQRFGDNVIDVCYYFLDENEKVAKHERRIGKGVMGLADLVIDLKLKYGNPEMVNFTEELFKFIATISYDESVNLAIEKGSFYRFNADKFLESGYMKRMPEYIRERIRKYGIRNVTSLTVAPTGSTGAMLGVANGIEPYYAFKYYRSGRLGEFIEINTPIAQKYFEEHPDATNLPDYYVSAMDLTPEEHVLVQAAAQKWVDSSISKTVNAPSTFTVEDNKKLYMLAYEMGLKGITIYVDGSRDSQVLSLKKDKLTSSTKLCKIEVDKNTGNLITEC